MMNKNNLTDIVNMITIEKYVNDIITGLMPVSKYELDMLKETKKLLKTEILLEISKLEIKNED